MVVINARTGERQLIWSELDSNATTPAATALLIRPAKNLREGERYIVALRRLRGGGRQDACARGRAFRLYRDGVKTDSAAFERRRAAHGVDLPLAAPGGGQAARSLPGLGLHGGQRAVAVAASALDPRPRVRGARRPRPRRPAACRARRRSSRSTPSPTSPRRSSRNVARRVEGHVTVPCFLDRPAARPVPRYRLGADGLPQRIPGNIYGAAFICNMPALGHARASGAAVAVRARAVRRRGRGARGQRGAAGRREQRARLRRGLDRDVGERHPQRRRDPAPTCRASPAWRTASSRASSTSCSSAGR